MGCCCWSTFDNTANVVKNNFVYRPNVGVDLSRSSAQTQSRQNEYNRNFSEPPPTAQLQPNYLFVRVARWHHAYWKPTVVTVLQTAPWHIRRGRIDFAPLQYCSGLDGESGHGERTPLDPSTKRACVRLLYPMVDTDTDIIHTYRQTDGRTDGDSKQLVGASMFEAQRKCKTRLKRTKLTANERQHWKNTHSSSRSAFKGDNKHDSRKPVLRRLLQLSLALKIAHVYEISTNSWKIKK